jgi:hypothetical protein
MFQSLSEVLRLRLPTRDCLCVLTPLRLQRLERGRGALIGFCVQSLRQSLHQALQLG